MGKPAAKFRATLPLQQHLHADCRLHDLKVSPSSFQSIFSFKKRFAGSIYKVIQGTSFQQVRRNSYCYNYRAGPWWDFPIANWRASVEGGRQVKPLSTWLLRWEPQLQFPSTL